jgi:hypothetical protein
MKTSSFKFTPKTFYEIDPSKCWPRLTPTNTLAYYAMELITALCYELITTIIFFIVQGPYSQNFILVVSYEFS